MTAQVSLIVTDHGICLESITSFKDDRDAFANKFESRIVKKHPGAGEARDTAMAEFYEKWQNDSLVVLKWLTMKAASNVPNNVETAKQLLDHKAFNIKNPNCCYSTFIGFAQSHPNFHAEDGSGYKFLADCIIKVWAPWRASLDLKPIRKF